MARGGNHNPTGKGGFRDHPENINKKGRPNNENSVTYWLNYFKGLSVDEFISWIENNPKDKRTIASEMAYIRVAQARKSLPDFKEVVDRTEGKAKQTIELYGDFNELINKTNTILDEILNK